MFNSIIEDRNHDTFPGGSFLPRQLHVHVVVTPSMLQEGEGGREGGRERGEGGREGGREGGGREGGR